MRLELSVVVFGLACLLSATGCTSRDGTIEYPDVDVGPADRSGRSEFVIGPSDMVPTPDTTDWQGLELPDAKGQDIPVEFICDPGKRAFGCPCTGNQDCASGWCVLHLGEKTCTDACVEECPDAWSCQEMAGSGTDTVFACKSLLPSLCLPCSSSNECEGPGAGCLPYGGNAGSFCGGGCLDDGSCPDSYECKPVVTLEGLAVNQCVAEGAGCSCTGYAIVEALQTVCQVSNDWGTCVGWRVCVETGLTDCDAPAPALEVCDGGDGDCDGLVDDGVDCDDGNPCTKDECGGAKGCLHNGQAMDDMGCSDSDACTQGDYCDNGLCSGLQIDCDDGNSCTEDSCDSGVGCVHEDVTAECDDDGDPCTLDVCVAGDCTHPAGNDGAGCDDLDPCTVDDFCDSGECVPGVDEEDCLGACGDGECVYGEGPELCPVDCGWCGDGVCGNHEAGLDGGTCPKDCLAACGNGICEGGESAVFCKIDCGGCGDDFCGLNETHESCQGDCPPGCGNGECEGEENPDTCPPDCMPPCGDGLCENGENAYNCLTDCGWCGDSLCVLAKGESIDSCPQDCVTPCGNGVCEGGENPEDCAVDCGWCGDGVCGFAESESGCPPDCSGGCGDKCSGKECGPDGCGGSCGTCEDGNPCTDDICAPETGLCSFADTDCDDGSVCTTDYCHPDSGCEHTPISCDDGDVCTENLCDPVAGCTNPLIVTPNPEPTDCGYLELGNLNDTAPMCRVPFGAFQMGSEPEVPGAIGGSSPPHDVCLTEYYIDQHEVTNAQYAGFVAEHPDAAPVTCTSGEAIWTAGDPPTYPGDKADHPAVCVTWNQALDYCMWVGKSLPTEAQWEKAARGAEANIYPWGPADPTCELANYKQGMFGDPCVGGTTPVLSVEAPSYSGGVSPFGLYDMAGNVTEWVWDTYGSCYYCHSPGVQDGDCEPPCDNALPHDPVGPPKTDPSADTVRRGGGWSRSNEFLLTDMREYVSPASAADYGGFRCAYQECPAPCPDNEYCVAGKCACVSDCTGKDCGDDGCGGSCGECDETGCCDAGNCVGDGIVGSGYIVITEIMRNPMMVADTLGEFVEVYNTRDCPINLDGWHICDKDADMYAIDASEGLVVPPHGFLVLGRNKDQDTNGGVPVDYAYYNLTLSNGVDEFILSKQGIVSDAVEWDAGVLFPASEGHSMNLDPDAFSSEANDIGSNWCETISANLPGGDFGTPGKPNEQCP